MTAVLDVNTVDQNTTVSVWARTLNDNVNHLLCNLSHRHQDAILNLIFARNQQVNFFIRDNATVYLIGIASDQEDDSDHSSVSSLSI